MKRFKYQAIVSLYPPQPDGLQASLPAQTRCLVVRAHNPDTHRTKLFRCVVTAADERPLAPGDARRVVTVQVNGDDARDYVHPGDHFELWFGTDIGQGIVSRQMFI